MAIFKEIIQGDF